MYKEFALVVLCMALVFLLYWQLLKKNKKLFQKVFVIMVIGAISLNTWYNFSYIFPTYIYEGVPLGDAEENLFSYKKDSHFQWQIIFPVIQNRTVSISTDAIHYKRFFDTYAKSVDNLEISQDNLAKLVGQKDKFELQTPLTMIQLLDYAFFEWEDRSNIPQLYVTLEKLQGVNRVVALSDQENNLYIMSYEFYMDNIE